jgi:acetoin utilization protein AcuB
MQGEVITVSPDDTLSTALALTRKHRVRHLPVVLSSGEIAGILSDRDIRLAMPSPLTTPDAERADYLERTAIASIMNREVITIGPSETVEDAAKLLVGHRIGSLPVVDPEQRLQGILTDADILHAFVRLLGVASPSSRLEIGLEDRPGELGRALSTLGARTRINIVSVVVPPFLQEGRKRAVIHLDTIDPREAIETLEQAGFVVGWPSLDRDVLQPRKAREEG